MNPRTIGGPIICWAFCLSIVLNGYLLFRPDSFGRNLVRALRHPDEVTHGIKSIDRLYSDLRPDENVVLAFRNFSTENESVAELLYYRSGYSAFPRKVFAAPPETVINHGRDLLAAAFEPNEQWLDEHRVGQVIVYEQQADGNVKASLIRRDLP